MKTDTVLTFNDIPIGTLFTFAPSGQGSGYTKVSKYRMKHKSGKTFTCLSQDKRVYTVEKIGQ